MRILAMTNLYPNPYQPHRAPYNRHQFRILAQRHSVQVIAPIAWTDEIRARRNGAPPLPPDRAVTLDGSPVTHPRYLFPPKLARGWYGHCYQASVGRTFRRILQEFQPDLLFAPWAYPDGWAAVRLGHGVGLPVILQVHGSDVLLLDKFPARRRRTREAVVAADGVVAVSADLASHLRQLGVTSSKIRVIYDGVDLSIFTPGSKDLERDALGVPRDEKIVLFVGNLLPVKAVDVLLNACNDPALRATPFRLILVGQGSQRPELEQMAASLGIAAKVLFLGSLPQIELPRWYRVADVFVLPSHSEGVPNVLLEASACGTRWVASRVGGIPEIAHLGVSRLVPPNTPAELASAIREALDSPPLNLPPRPKAREEAVTELEEFFQCILDDRSQSRVLT